MKSLFLSLIILTLTACSGGSGGDSGGSPSPDTPKNGNNPVSESIRGIFLDNQVQGLDYKTSSGSSGTTDEHGQFDCKEDDTISFYIGDVLVGSTSCKELVTPISLFFDEDLSDSKKTALLNNDDSLSNNEKNKLQKITNVLTLLQSLDNDPSDDKITISSSTKNSLNTNLNISKFDFSDSHFGMSKTLSVLVNELSSDTGETLTIVTSTNAATHFKTTLATPILKPISYETKEDTPLTFEVFHFLGDKKTTTGVYKLGTISPSKGSFSCTNNKCVYSPNQDTFGEDTFTYIVDYENGTKSKEVPVKIKITPVNDNPTISSSSFTVNEDVSSSISIIANDVDGDNLTYKITTQVTNGTLSGTAPNLTYVSNSNYNGSDYFTVSVSDGNDSYFKTINLTINNTNDEPTFSNQGFHGDEDNPLTMRVTSTDIDGDTLSYTVKTQPNNGSLSGTVPNLTYTPNLNYNGTDSFTVSVSDGSVTKDAVISAVIAPVNDSPTTQNVSVSTSEDSDTVNFTLSSSDVDGDTISYTAQSSKSGTLNCNNNSCSYKPNTNFNGSEQISFSVSDGKLSNNAFINIIVSPENDAPVLDSVSTISIAKDSQNNAINLSVNDIDGDTTSFILVSQATNGTASCNNSCNYTPNSSFTGSDSITVKANDGTTDSNTITINFNVKEMIALAGDSQLPINMLSSTSYKEIKFKTNQGEDPESPSSVSTHNLIYEIDTSSTDSAVVIVKCHDDSGYENYTQENSCLFYPRGTGSTSMKVKVSNSTESTAWYTLSINIGLAPVANEVKLTNITDNATFDITLDYSGTNISSIEISNLSSHITSDNISLYKNNTKVTGSSVNLTTSDSLKITVKDDFLLSDLSHNLFDYKVTDSLDFTSTNSVVMENGNGVIQKNATSKVKDLAKFMNTKQTKLNKVIEYSYPWKTWNGTCSATGDLYDSNLSNLQSFRQHLHPNNDNWEFVFFKDSNSELYLVGYKEVLPGVKVFMTPYHGDGSKVQPVNKTYYLEWAGTYYTNSYNIDYAQNGSTTSLTQMKNYAKNLWYSYSGDSFDDNWGLDRNSRFKIDIVFSDSDLSHNNFSFTSSSSDFKKNKFFIDTNEDFYLNGKMDGSSYYMLDMRQICGESLVANPYPSLVNSNYWANIAVDRSYPTAPGLSWLSYGDTSNSTTYSKEVGYTLSFSVGSSVKNSSDDSDYYLMYSEYNSFFDLSRKKGGSSFLTTFANTSFSFDSVFSNYGYKKNTVFRVFSFYQHSNIQDGNSMFTKGDMFSSVNEPSLLSFTNKISEIDGTDGPNVIINDGDFYIKGYGYSERVDSL